ncbi:MAG TPA: hypothetical protein VGJ59_19720 [Jatrophihabitantaceae bacterium]|jgi:hypothetical protein
MAIWAWILIAVVVIVAAVLAAAAMRQRRTTMLRQQFGPEYERTMQERDDRRAAESDLRDRQKQRDRLDIRPLAEPTRARFAAEWRELQERFVDQPADTVVAADGLVYRVMSERGYPMDNFEAQAKLVSVDHPSVVENYRFAHAVCERAQSQQASTEDLRAALLHYRSLFDDLLQSDGADRTREAPSHRRDAPDREEPEQQSTQRGIR